MRIDLFCYSNAGANLLERIQEIYQGEDVRAYAVEKFARPNIEAVPSTCRTVGTCFGEADMLIFVGAVGIAVRAIAPHLCHKSTDPAVLVLDDKGQYVIPLLSGHIGGANAQAKHLAQCLGAVPILTTATDIHGRFAVDTWASERGLLLSSLKTARGIASDILEHDLPLHSDFPILGDLPQGLYLGNSGERGICITCRKKQPFGETLRVIPKILHVGMGCRKGIDPAQVEAFFLESLAQENFDLQAVKCLATVDRKAEEPALLYLAEHLHLPLHAYPVSLLNAQVGDFTPSRFVQETLGTDNVCERSAVCSAGGGQVCLKKTAKAGVTLAFVLEEWSVSF